MKDLGKVLDRLPYPFFLILVAIGGFLLINFCYSPNLENWMGVGNPATHPYPELNRAIDSLDQLRSPFAFKRNPSNEVIRWRLLFPLAGHALHLSPVAYMSLPFIGAAAVLGLMAHLIFLETHCREVAACSSLVLGTTSWFFTSCGWLCYFDSWYVMGLLCAAFMRSRLVLLGACLLTPWVDERFIVALPLALIVRSFYLEGFPGYDRRQWRSEVILTALATVPWVLLRVMLIVLHADNSSTVNSFGMHLSPGIAGQLVWGIWEGFRAGWLYVGMLLVLVCRPGAGWRYRLLTYGMAATLAVHFILAGDLSRSVSALLPVAFLGIVLGWRVHPQWIWRSLPLVLAFNLLFPAHHVVTGFVEPIKSFPVRWQGRQNQNAFLQN